ncbi:MAG TPA: 23S rRNA (adenine(2503)-C(2))-methyltransferase RlmN [Pirellulales bacterium]|jgi:23S rRNA (adenine2503-C2)-methyltransferase|nr:23S rRNA (adenine(2503)-C(2))-methyltransferase RlmN [Pirellulales bacterium]
MLHLLDPVVFATLPHWLAQSAGGAPAYRAEQIRQWLFAGRAEAFDDMTNLPKPLRQQLAAEFTIWTTTTERHHQATDGTEKLLLRLADGHHIECVLLRDGSRRTICISSQVGCAMGCVFCASGLDGVVRNLTAGEIVEQMLRLQRLLPKDSPAGSDAQGESAGERLSHIVVMGMGEPLANLDRLLPALAEATSPTGLGISHRRITISTVGLPPAMDRLAELDSRFQLAVSLHAPNDELRNQLVPVNKNIGLSAIVAAADRYFEASGRRLTFEYVLLGGLNDQPEHACELAQLLRGRLALVNLIPYNAVPGLPYHAPTQKAVQQFVTTLEQAGLNAQIRERKGDEINAACGQLRRAIQMVV